MSTATKKPIVIADNKPYASFNAYQRPKRTNNSFRKPENVKIVNLDPTDDPSKVCDAYRQIRIKEQNQRIAKNEARLAEKRRIADAKAAKAAAKEEERERNRQLGIAKALKSRRESTKSMSSRQRQAGIRKAFLAGTPIDLKATSIKRCHIETELANLRVRGHDIVSITSAGGDQRKGMSISCFVIDQFERPTKHINEIYAVSPTDVQKVIIDGLKQGYVLQADDIRASQTAIRRAVAQLRLDGWPICVMKNRSIDSKPRGWILPCEANGLQDIKAE